MKLSTSSARAARAAPDRRARRLDAQRRPGALRRADRRRPTAASSCAPPTWRSACASRSRPRSSAPGTVVLPGAPAARRRPPAARRRRVARAAARPSRTSRSSPAPRRFHIRTLRAEDFPPLPEPGGDQIVTMPAPAFVETIARVARSASRDETRPILTGILVSASGDELRMVATDSYRLSVKETRARGRRSTAASRPTCRPARSRSSAGSSRDDVEDDPHRRARQPGRLRGRRRRAVVAPDRRSVPQLPPAAARGATSTSCTIDRRGARRASCAASACMAQKNAPLRLALQPRAS